MKRNIWLLPLFYGVRSAYIYVPFLAPLLVSVGLNDFRVLVLIAVSQFVSGVLEIPTGLWADRLSRRASLMSGALCNAVAFALYARVDGFNADAIAAAVLTGLGTALIMGADTALLYETYQRLGREFEARVADGHARSIGGIAEAVSTFAGIGLQLVVGYRGFMWMQVGIMVVTLCVAAALHEEPVVDEPLPIRSIVRHCRQPELASTLLFAACAGGLSGVLVWWTPVYYLAESGLQIGKGPYGWVYNLCWGVFLMSLFVFRRTIPMLDNHRERSLPALIALAAVCYAVVATGPVAIGMVFILGTYYIRANIIPIAGQMINEKVTDAERATVHSVSRSIMWVLFGGILVVSSWVSSLAGSTRVGVAVGGAIIVGLTAATFAWMRRSGGHVSPIRL